MRTVYLAGPIADHTVQEANDWRIELADALATHNLKGISPLRCEPVIGDRYGLSYDDLCFGTHSAIAGKNFFDVKNCDFTIAYLPSKSIGTIIEIAWASSFGKPVIVISNLPGVRDHPLVRECANWIVPDFKYAVKILQGVLGDYLE